MSALSGLQAEFQDYVLGRGGAQPAIAASVADQFGLAAPERLAIYYNAYRIRMREALAEAYGKTWTYIGDAMFEELATAYLDAYPSSYRNLRWFGGDFADFAAERLGDYPFVAELARFEWALGLAFDAADAPVLTRAALQALPPEAWGELRFALHPSVQRLSCHWNAVALWQGLDSEDGPPEAASSSEPAAWLVWRCKLQPHFRSLDAFEDQALLRIAGGASFAQVCAEMAETAEGEDVTLRMAGCLQHWLDQELLTPASPQPQAQA